MANKVSIKVYRNLNGINPYEVYYGHFTLESQNIIEGTVSIEKNGSYYDLWIAGGFKGGYKTLKATAEAIEKFIEKRQAEKVAFKEITDNKVIKELENLKEAKLYVTPEELIKINAMLMEMRKGTTTEPSKNISKIYSPDSEKYYYIEHDNIKYSYWWYSEDNDNLALNYIRNKIASETGRNARYVILNRVIPILKKQEDI